MKKILYLDFFYWVSFSSHLLQGSRSGSMAAPMVHFPIVLVIRLLGVAAAATVLTWALHFRGGMSLASENKDLIFNVHPVLMVIGFILLNGEGILAYKTIGGTKNFKKAVHLAVQFLAFFLGLIGIWAALKFHNDKGIDNFYSLHSWLGLACLFLFGVQWGAGFATFWYPGGSRNSRAFLLPWHVFLGIYIYILAVATAATGILEKATFLQSSSIISRYSTEAFLLNSLGLLLVFLAGFVILAVVTPASIKGDIINSY
ncbi:Ascorbate ferrireductase (transmembrane) protein [Dioscorea alata]|uniref:Ascorbate ferrireductase (Transmembrane) protein n=1 Tax=Dioscorea alata TaxID=55571 RepID=A0ACB7WEA8_DIOAL|nr:Ascorbate ferrireductase (transmembrane) protein [Dioscorea alata]